MITSMIAAVAQDMAIGNKGQLVFYIREDLKRFKALTTGHTIIMGRKTFESLPKGALPNRRNVVLSRADFQAEGIEVYHDLATALDSCIAAGEDEAFIIGGESIYRAAMPLATRLYITHIDDTPQEADAFFPAIGTEWKVDKKEVHEGFSFVDYIREQ